MSTPDAITSEARVFLEPGHPRQRQYEALRAYFVEGLPSPEAARRFGYTAGSFRVLCHKFRRGDLGAFFRDLPRGPQVQATKDPARPRILALRKQNLSIYFATALGGLFVFVPWLVRLDLAGLVTTAGLPGTRMIPAAQAVRATLALKLTGTERKSHVMDRVFDEGLALWTGLNVPPKPTFLSQYSGRLGPRRLAALLEGWIRPLRGQPVLPGQSFSSTWRP